MVDNFTVGIPLRGSETSPQVYGEEGSNRCRVCPRQWDECTACLLVLSVLTTAAVLACAGLLIALSVTLAGPQLTVFSYVSGSCTVVNATFTGDRPSCACHAAPRCKGTYPCLAVTVKYSTSSGQEFESMLYEDEHVFNYRPHCSYQPSSCSPGHNPDSVYWFQQEYGKPGRTYACFHDPAGPGALRLRTRDTSYVVHIILWPALFLVIFSVLWCVIHFYCCPRAQR